MSLLTPSRARRLAMRFLNRLQLHHWFRGNFLQPKRLLRWCLPGQGGAGARGTSGLRRPLDRTAPQPGRRLVDSLGPAPLRILRPGLAHDHLRCWSRNHIGGDLQFLPTAGAGPKLACFGVIDAPRAAALGALHPDHGGPQRQTWIGACAGALLASSNQSTARKKPAGLVSSISQVAIGFKELSGRIWPKRWRFAVHLTLPARRASEGAR